MHLRSIVFLLLINECFAQSESVSNSSRILDYEGDLIYVGGTINGNDDSYEISPLQGVSVYVIGGDGHHVETSFTFSDSTGYYSQELEYDRFYNLLFVSEGRYTKILEINTFNIPEEEKNSGGFIMVIDIKVPLVESRRKERLLEKHPIGKCAFSSETHAFEWDTEYTEKFVKRLDRKPWWQLW